MKRWRSPAALVNTSVSPKSKKTVAMGMMLLLFES
jgi:hypothetical protein